MIVTPAIDLRSGKCVQLVGGSYDRQVVELDDPVAIAKSWFAQGFETLHVVDLDAATGRGSNSDLIDAILESADAEVQVGGGLRTRDPIDRLIAAGAARVVIGTRAIGDRAWLQEIASAYPGRIVVAVDVRERSIVTHGWQATADAKLDQQIASLNDLPLGGILVTAVHMEGQMKGPDLGLMREIAERSVFPVQASGGISTISDIRALAQLGVSSAIVGMALYTGILSASQIATELNQ